MSVDRLQVLIEAEAAFGHTFLFVPVLVSAGAVACFSLPVEPPAVFMLMVFGLLSLSCFSAHWMKGYAPPFGVGVALFLAGAVLRRLRLGGQE